ncbi:MAG: MFS transporter [Neisseria sp.]|nr:MFS transporter [Neisseria sp.]
MTHTHPPAKAWQVIAAASLILLITIGMRMSLGLFMEPVVNTTELSIRQYSMVVAVFQLVWGVAQPISGALADRYGAGRVLSGGALLLAASCLSVPLLPTVWGMLLTIGLLMALGTGAGGFSIIMSQVAANLPPRLRGTASGAVNAGGSLGQFLFAPMVQRLIANPALGWQGAFYVWGILSLLILPAVKWLSCGKTPVRQQGEGKAAPAGQNGQTLGQAVSTAFKDRSYILLHLGFFTCGFHIAFLVTHLPTEISLCGLPPKVASNSLAVIGLANIAGCLFSGWCVGRFRSKYILFCLYASRVALILTYLAAPRTDENFYLFAAGLGFSWLATVAPTAAVTGKLFGTRYLATLFGLTMLSHQVGGFLGSSIGGAVVTRFNDYSWMWYADAALAATAAILSLPIRENKVD